MKASHLASHRPAAILTALLLLLGMRHLVAQDSVSVLLQSGHSGGVGALAYSPDARLLVSAGKDGVVKVIDVATGLVVNQTQACAYWLHAVVFIDADSVLLSCGDGRVLRWRVAGVAPPTAVLATPDGYTVRLTAHPSRPDVFVRMDNRLQVSAHTTAPGAPTLWQAPAPGQIRITSTTQVEMIDANTVVVSSQTLSDLVIERRDVTTGQILSSVRPKGMTAFTSLAVNAGDVAYATGADFTQTDGSGGNRNVGINVVTGEYVDLHPALGDQFVSRLAFTPDGTLVGVGLEQVIRWTPGSLDVQLSRIEHAFAPADGPVVFAGSSERIAWLTALGTIRETPLLETGGGGSETVAAPMGVSSLAVSNDDSLLAIGSFNGVTHLWSLAEGKAIASGKLDTHDPIYSVYFKDNVDVLVASTAGKAYIWNPISGVRREIADAGQRPWDSWSHNRLPSECFRATKSFGCGPPRPMPPIIRGIDDERIEGSFEAAAYSKSGAYVVGGEQNLMMLPLAQGGSSLDLRHNLTGEIHPRILAVSDDGTRIAFVQLNSSALELMSLPAGGDLQRTHFGEPVTAFKFLPGSHTRLVVIQRNGTVLEIDTATGSVEPRAQADADSTLLLEVSRDSKYVAAAGFAGRIHIWDRSNGWRHSVLEGHTAGVMALSFLNTKPLLASGSGDGSIRLWNHVDATQLVQLQTFADGAWLATDGDGFFDGPEEAWSHVLLRVANGPAVLKPNRLAQLLFQPGLLRDAVRTTRTFKRSLVASADARANLTPSFLAQRRPPTVAIAGAPLIEAGVATLRLRVTDRGHGMSDLRVFRNGTRVALAPGELSAGAPNAKEFVRTFPVRLAAGRNRIAAYAFDSVGVQSDEAVADIDYQPPAPRQAAVYALSVGIDLYDDADRIKKLNYAETDAQAFDSSLDEIFGTRSDIAQPIRHQRIPGADASRQRILDTIEALSRCSHTSVPTISDASFGACPGPDDLVVIFFAGHGARLNERFLFLARDTNAGDEEALVSSSISDLDLERVLADIDARRVILIVDACHSGAIAADSGARVGPFNARGLAQLAYEKGIFVLGASQSYQAALEVERHQHGLLTYALVSEGLLARAADFSPVNGEIVDDEWVRFPITRVPQLHREMLSDRITRGQRVGNLVDGGSDYAIAGVQLPSLYVPPKRGAAPFRISP